MTKSATVSVNVQGTTTVTFSILQPSFNGSNDNMLFANTSFQFGGTTVTPSSVTFTQVTPSGTNYSFDQGGTSTARLVTFTFTNVPLALATPNAFHFLFNYSTPSSASKQPDPNQGPQFFFQVGNSSSVEIGSYQNSSSYFGAHSNEARDVFFSYAYTGSGVNPTITGLHDPLIFDLGQAGVDLSAIVSFDMNNDGHAGTVHWTAGQDGILVMDLDGSGTIESGREVFSPFFGVGGFADGMAALATLD